MIEYGQVISISNKNIIIKIKKTSSCEKCNKCIKRSDGSFILNLKNPGGFVNGDSVIIEIPEGKMIKNILILYGLPILGLFIGFIIADFISFPMNKEIIQIISGIIVLILTFFLVKFFLRNYIDLIKIRKE